VTVITGARLTVEAIMSETVDPVAEKCTEDVTLDSAGYDIMVRRRKSPKTEGYGIRAGGRIWITGRVVLGPFSIRMSLTCFGSLPL